MKLYLSKSRFGMSVFASVFFLVTTGAYAATWQISSLTQRHVNGYISTFIGAHAFEDGQFAFSNLTPSLNVAIDKNFGIAGGNLTFGFAPYGLFDSSYRVESQAQAPTVNLSSMTINVSSMFMSGWGPATSGLGYQTMIGSSIAPYYSPYSVPLPSPFGTVGNKSSYGLDSTGIALQYAGINCVKFTSNTVVDPSCFGIIPIIDNNDGTYTAAWYSTLNNFVKPGNHFTMTFTQVVPIPASLWLLCSGLLGLMGIARRKTA